MSALGVSSVVTPFVPNNDEVDDITLSSGKNKERENESHEEKKQDKEEVVIWNNDDDVNKSHSEPTGATKKSTLGARKKGRRYPCQWENCNYIAASPSAREKHWRTHTGKKPAGCPYCPYRAALEVNLRRHIKNAHINTQRDLCVDRWGKKVLGNDGGPPRDEAEQERTTPQPPVDVLSLLLRGGRDQEVGGGSSPQGPLTQVQCGEDAVIWNVSFEDVLKQQQQSHSSSNDKNNSSSSAMSPRDNYSLLQAPFHSLQYVNKKSEEDDSQKLRRLMRSGELDNQQEEEWGRSYLSNKILQKPSPSPALIDETCQQQNPHRQPQSKEELLNVLPQLYRSPSDDHFPPLPPRPPRLPAVVGQWLQEGMFNREDAAVREMSSLSRGVVGEEEQKSRTWEESKQHLLQQTRRRSRDYLPAAWM